MNKKGLSSVVTTILIIAVSIVVLAILSFVVINLVRNGGSMISLGQFTIDVSLKSASIDYDDGTANVKVARGVGNSNLIGLKFVFEDSLNSEVVERRFTDLDELEERTFVFNLTSECPNLILTDIRKVSIVPIILSDDEKEILGSINKDSGSFTFDLTNQTESFIEPSYCTENSDCGIDYLIDGTRYCSSNNLYQYKKIYTCNLGFCTAVSEPIMLEDCAYLCFVDSCISEQVSCNPGQIEEDCGVNGWTGPKTCSVEGDLDSVIQDWKEYSCIDHTCSVEIYSQTFQVCTSEEICYEGACFIPLECTQNSDCDLGETCNEGSCVTEIALNSGAITSIWPFGIGEYFDSTSLTDPTIESYVGKYISFSGNQQGCLEIVEHLWPAKPNGAPYVRLNVSSTNISAGENYYIWETNFYCNI
ncbi:MAG: hypothetical protein WC812_00980 [Candidatus Pacearchaeota archaeon]|jgi:hypothetical protein